MESTPLSFLEDAEFWTPATLLAKTKEKENKLKIIETKIPFASHTSLFDISIESHEDEVYAKKPSFSKNIRRGNCLIQTDYSLFVGRRGLMKFFDLSLKYLDAHKYSDLSVGAQNKLQNYILGGAQRVFAETENKVKLFKTLKLDGENAQISYCEELDCWIIGSKNVSLALRTLQDYKGYRGQESRNRSAFESAKVWFKIYGMLSKSQQREIIKVAKEYTLVGELIGGTQDHFSKYEDRTIGFYALVGKYAEDTCLSPTDAFKFFKQNGLTTASTEERGMYSSIQELLGAVEKVYMEVTQSKIEENHEGSVLYFVEVDSKQQERTLSLCKLKTGEYRLFKTLRDRLRETLKPKNKDSKKQTLEQIKAHFNKLSQTVGLPRDIGFYLKLADRAYSKLQKDPKAVEKLKNKFMDFCQEVASELGQNVQFLTNLEQRKVSKSLILLTNPGALTQKSINNLRSNFELIEGKTTQEEESKQDKQKLYLYNDPKQIPASQELEIVTYINETAEEQKEGATAMYKEIESFIKGRNGKVIREAKGESRQTELLNYLEQQFIVKIPEQKKKADYFPEEEIKKKQVKRMVRFKDESKTNKVVMLMPQFYKGVGKTRLGNQLSSYCLKFGISYSSVNYNDVYNARLQICSEQNPKKPDQAQSKATSQANQAYKQIVHDVLVNINSSKKKQWVLYLDHDHTKNTRTKLLQKIKEVALSNLQIIQIAILPKDQGYWNVGKAGNVALSYNLFFQCLARKLLHVQTQDQKIKYIEEFHRGVVGFKKTHYAEAQLISEGFSKVIKLPFVPEKELASLQKFQEISTALANSKKGKAIDPNAQTFYYLYCAAGPSLKQKEDPELIKELIPELEKLLLFNSGEKEATAAQLKIKFTKEGKAQIELT